MREEEGCSKGMAWSISLQRSDEDRTVSKGRVPSTVMVWSCGVHVSEQRAQEIRPSQPRYPPSVMVLVGNQLQQARARARMTKLVPVQAM